MIRRKNPREKSLGVKVVLKEGKDGRRGDYRKPIFIKLILQSSLKI